MSTEWHTEKGIAGRMLNQNYFKVCFSRGRQSPKPTLHHPKAFKIRKGEGRREEQGFKDARYSPPQLWVPEVVFPHTHRGKSESRTKPFPTASAPPPAASPVRPPPPHYSIALGAKTDSSQGLLQSAFLLLSWLPQPVSRLCSLRLCFGQSPFPPPPRPRLDTTPGSGLRGGRTPWAQVGPQQSRQV